MTCAVCTARLTCCDTLRTGLTYFASFESASIACFSMSWRPCHTVCNVGWLLSVPFSSVYLCLAASRRRKAGCQAFELR